MYNEKKFFYIEAFNEVSIYLLLLVLPIFFLRIQGQFMK